MDRVFYKENFLYLLFICLIFLSLALRVFSWVIDDLYIYFRYANNFTNGKGIVYNPGEYVEGFSSFAWFLILSLFSFLKLPLEFAAKIAGLVFAFLNLLLLYKICIRLNSGRLSLLCCSLMMLNLPFILWAVSGFEIMFYIFLLLFCFYNVIDLKTSAEKLMILSPAIFLISLSRPEGVLFSLAFIAFTYIISRDISFSGKLFFIYGILFGSFLLFRYLYFGDILPNTYFAKIGHDIFGYYEIRTYKNGFFYILDFFRHNPQFLVAAPLIAFSLFNLKKLILNKILYFILVIIFLQFFFVIYSGGDWMVQYRFLIPAIPFLSLALTISLKEFMKIFSLKKIVADSIIAFVILLTAVSLMFADYKIIDIETVLWNNLKELSSGIKKEIPENNLVANGSSGIIPYYLDNVNFLDIVGLTNKYIARNGFRHGTWFEKSLPGYVYSRNPGWLIMWKKKKEDGIYKFENASPCYFDMSQDINFKKYSLHKTYDVYDDVRIELYKLNDKAN